MGQATILEALGRGQYRARLEYDTKLLEQRIAATGKRRQALLSVRSEAVVAESEARAALTAARSVLNGLIDEFAAGLVERSAVSEATAEALRANAVWQAAVFKRESLDAQLLGLSLALSEMERVRTLPEPELVLWCADYSEGLSGLVGTIEPTGEPVGEDPAGLLPVLHPGWEGAGAWRCERDGVYVRQAANAVFASLLDGAQLAAWQMHRPRHRLAQIVAIDGGADTCSVVVDSARSSVQALPIDPADRVLLTQVDVPVLYMNCNTAAFAVGDRVVVAFAGDWTTPMVIGFEAEPRPCALGGFLIVPAGVAALNGWGEPITEQNGPLGTPGGSGLDAWNHRYTVVTPEGEFLRRTMPAYDALFPVAPFSPRPVAGNCDWFGEALGGRPVTWDKSLHRYFDSSTEWLDPVSDQASYDFLLGQRVDRSFSPVGDDIHVTGVVDQDGRLEVSGSSPIDGLQVYFAGRDVTGIGDGLIKVVSPIAGLGAAEHTYQQDGVDITVTWLIWVAITGTDPTGQDVLQETVFSHQVELDAGGELHGMGEAVALLVMDYRPNPNGRLCMGPNRTGWSFAQSGRAAAAIRTHCEDDDGTIDLYELAFVVDESGVLVGAPDVSPAAAGSESWETVSAGHFTHTLSAQMTVIAAVDYKDNQLVQATVTQQVQDDVVVDVVPLVSTDNVNAGSRVQTFSNMLTFGGRSVVLSSGTITDTSGFTPPVGDWPLPVAYETTLERVTDTVERALLWLDLRSGYVAWLEVADTSSSLEVFSGVNVSSGGGGDQYDWTGVTTEDGAYAYSETFDGPGQVWADSYETQLVLDKSGTGDPIYDGNDGVRPQTVTGIELEAILFLYPGSGTREYIGRPYATSFGRPAPVVLSNAGELAAISSASGFNTAPWALGKRRGFYHYPAGLLDRAGLAGKDGGRVCPVVRM